VYSFLDRMLRQKIVSSDITQFTSNNTYIATSIFSSRQSAIKKLGYPHELYV
jgi:hypothetical protein